MTWPRAIEAIESSDTDELLRVIDGLCAARDWDRLLELRRRCAEAVTRGKQVWGVEEHIRYRLALEAPAPIAGSVVSEGGSRFGLGPLPEVAASTKTWAEMDPHLTPGPDRDTFAAERVVRGDRVDEIPDLPAHLQPWEPAYETATYKSDGIEAPSPSLPPTLVVELPENPTTIDDLPSAAALADLVEAWTDQSNGRCQTAAAEGDHLAAIAALGMTRARAADLGPSSGMAWMAWAGASAGAHGRRRGAAAGRYLAWWAVATLTDQDWPADPDVMGRAATSLAWHWFDDGSPETGWVLRLALTSPDLGLSWAISATDQD
ncbi:MAG TPA: hypothetical protein VFV13_12915 [Acidimicrobiia bacterium]|nr:hypothetical protein [Acidimicrobiia bacterium]